MGSEIAILMPYIMIDGVPTFTNSFIKSLYRRMEKDKSATTVFLDGSVKDEDQFLDMMMYLDNALWILNVEKEIGGVVWLNNFEKKRAWFHFCFFSNIWGKNTVEIGKECISTLLGLKKGDEYEFDLLTGIVPERNEKALKWCSKMNFKILGRLPSGVWNDELQQSEAGIIYYVERGNYNG